MSRNISQIYIDNPSTTASDDDLFYKGNTPYGSADDSAIKFSDLQETLFSNNRLISYQLFGQGDRSALSLTDGDFVANKYILTNPCPNIISVNCTTPGNQIILPSAQGADSFQLFNGPEIINLGTQQIDIVSFSAITQTPLIVGADYYYILTDNSTTGGLWDVRSRYSTDLPVNVGNVATFSSVSGRIQDSGTALSGFVKQGDSGIYFGITPPTSLVSPKMLNLYATGTAGANAQNWYNNTDNYPLFQISPLNHDDINLNFDCYYDGSFLRASTGAIAWQLNKSGGHIKLLWGTGAQGNPISTNLTVDIDAAGRITLPQGGTLETLRLGTSASALNTTTPAMSFSTNYGAGNLINLAGSGRNIGFQSGLMFLTYNANYNAGVADYQVSSSGNVFVQELTSTGIFFKYQNSGTGGATVSLSTAISIDSTGVIGLPSLSSASTLLAVDSSKNIVNASGSYTFSGLTLDNGGAALSGTAACLNFSSALSDGDYINLGGSGRNIGVTNDGTAFISYNLDWDGGAATYKYNGSGNAFVVEVGPNGILFKSATSGSAGTPIVPPVGFQMQAAGAVDIPFVTDNSLVARVSGTITTAIGGSFQMAQLLLNSTTVPSLVQVGRLSLVGQNTTTANALNLYTHTDGYPLVNIVSPIHGTQYVNFDCYFDGTDSRSSYSSGSNFRLNKSSDLFALECEAGVAQGSTISWTTAWLADSLGNFQVTQVSASSLVVTDGSGNFRSASNLIITSDSTVTGSTQTAVNNTRYYINYAGGQCVVTLPAATAGGGPIEVVGLSTSSTSGWQVVAVGSDVIQFGASVSAAAGNIVSTTGSATDAITLRPIAGKWIVYPALGLNLVVT